MCTSRHNFGFAHASFAKVSYADPLDVMGLGDTKTGTHYQAAFKFSANWMPRSSVVQVHPFGPYDECPTCMRSGSFLLAPVDFGVAHTPKRYMDEIAASGSTSVAAQGLPFDTTASTATSPRSAMAFHIQTAVAAPVFTTALQKGLDPNSTLATRTFGVGVMSAAVVQPQVTVAAMETKTTRPHLWQPWSEL